MRESEKNNLRLQLNSQVKEWQQKRRPRIVTDFVQLHEDNGFSHVTEAELLVFGIDRKYLPALAVGWFAFEDLIAIVEPQHFEGELGALIVKARAICPAATWHEHQLPLTETAEEPQWYAWLCREFLNIPHRQSFAYFQKMEFNTRGLRTYQDETTTSAIQSPC